MLTLEEIRAQIHAFELDEYAEPILKSVKNAIHIRREQVEDAAIPIGASKLGGSPDVPPDFTWYTYQDTPLTFIGQFRLSEVAPHDVDHLLPERGMLYFFYEVNDFPDMRAGAEPTRVLYLPEEDLELRRFLHPRIIQEFQGKAYERGALTPWRASFSALATLKLRLLWRMISEERLRNEISKRHYDLYKKIEQLQGLKHQGGEPSHHWLLGNPTLLQSDPVETLALERTTFTWKDVETDAFQVEAAKWVLLAQFDSDPYDATWMWGSGGVLTFCMSKAQLKARDFSQVRCEANWT